MSLDRVPGDDELFIGGIIALRRREALSRANISHVLSVIRLPLDQALLEPYEHMMVEVDDVDDENLLEHFPKTNDFIRRGLESGGGVLVHCAMGKSRSATCVMAFLMQKYGLSPQAALERIQRARALCDPNDGFKQQLELYHQMQYPVHLDQQPAYQRWLYRREVDVSLACGQAPTLEQYEDERDQASSRHEHDGDEFALRCRKCRRTLGSSRYLAQHPPMDDDVSDPCAHYLLNPLSWMRPELELGRLDGRLECPKCKTNVGKYAWQGMKCSCGSWIVPAVTLARSRVDQVSIPAGAGPVGQRTADQSGHKAIL